MAQRVEIVYEDDLTGEEADETVTFGLDGATFEIDLSEVNAQALRDALAQYVGNARRVAGKRPRAHHRSRPANSAQSGEATPKEVREWARTNGLEVPDRGRIPAAVRNAYQEAN